MRDDVYKRFLRGASEGWWPVYVGRIIFRFTFHKLLIFPFFHFKKFQKLSFIGVYRAVSGIGSRRTRSVIKHQPKAYVRAVIDTLINRIIQSEPKSCDDSMSAFSFESLLYLPKE